MTARAPFAAAAALLLGLALVGCSAETDGDVAAGAPTSTAGASTDGPAAVPTSAPTTSATAGSGPVDPVTTAAPTEPASGAGTAPDERPAPSHDGFDEAGAGATAGDYEELPAVEVGETVAAPNGLQAVVESVSPSRIEGGVPGDVAGPAVAVAVSVANPDARSVELDRLVVSASYGDGLEAPGYDGGESDPLVGPVPAGETLRGVYVFAVPEGARGPLLVRAGVDPSSPLVVFTTDLPVESGDR